MHSLIKNKPTALIIKIGGSVLDAEFESSHAVVRQLIDPLKKLFKDFNVFITIGGGPSWDVRKQWQKNKMFDRRGLSVVTAPFNLLIP